MLNKKTNEKRNINVDGVFVAIGHNPNTQFLKNTLDLDRENYIQTVDFQTSIPGVFACGDCIVQYTDRSYQHTVKRYKQAIVAASDGCIAALQIIELMLNFK